jgi:hypothetical protein
MSLRFTRHLLGVLLCWLVLCLPGFAQSVITNDGSQARAEAQAALDREQRARDLAKSAADAGRLQIAITEATVARQRNVFRLGEAFKQLSRATDQLNRTLLAKGALKESASHVEKHTKVLLDYVKGINKEKVRFDSREFKGLSDSELGWEALTTAERIAPAIEFTIRSESQQKWDIRWLQALPELERELSRLQWMARQLK